MVEQLRHRLLMAQTSGGGSVLPSEYQQVEYLESPSLQQTGTVYAYINTNYTFATEKQRVVFQYMPLVLRSPYYINRLGGAYNGNRSAVLYVVAPYAYLGFGSQDINIGLSISAETWYTCDISSDNGSYDANVNGTSYSGTYSGTTISNYPYFLWCNNEKGRSQWGAYARISYFKMYDNDVLVREMYQCYRISDSVPGMYDIVNDVFYTQAGGSGSFVVGADV